MKNLEQITTLFFYFTVETCLFFHPHKAIKLYRDGFLQKVFVCFCDQCLAICQSIRFCFLITKAKLDLSLPTPQSSEVLGVKLCDGLFASQERAATFKHVCRPSQLMLLKCHLSLSRETRGNLAAKREY